MFNAKLKKLFVVALAFNMLLPYSVLAAAPDNVNAKTNTNTEVISDKENINADQKDNNIITDVEKSNEDDSNTGITDKKIGEKAKVIFEASGNGKYVVSLQEEGKEHTVTKDSSYEANATVGDVFKIETVSLTDEGVALIESDGDGIQFITHEVADDYKTVSTVKVLKEDARLCYVYTSGDSSKDASDFSSPALFAAKASTIGVTLGNAITWINSNGVPTQDVYKKIEGKYAFCMNANKNVPKKVKAGTKITSRSGKNGNILKALYYGYNGKKVHSSAKGGKGYIITSRVISEFWTGKGVSQHPYAKTFRNYVKKASMPPEGYYIIYYRANSSSKQPLCRLGYEAPKPKNGYLTLVKSSANPNLSNNNSCYSLEGAVYEVTDSNGKKVGELTTKADGTTNTLTLPVGKYTIKETTAPKGFALRKPEDMPNGGVVNVTAGSSTSDAIVYKTTDEPQADKLYDPFEVILHKKDTETGGAYPLAGASLEGAEFEIKFYDTFDRNQATGKPVKSWVLKTDKSGRIQIPQQKKDFDTYFVSGDEFYKDTHGQNVFALGTYTVQEIKAPEGYLIDSDVHVAQLTGVSTTTDELVDTWNMLDPNKNNILEQVERGDLKFIKADTDKDRLVNCVFSLTSESTGESHLVVTDDDGHFETKGPINVETVNKNDEALNADGTIDESKLNWDNKVWFGMSSDGSITEPNADLRPLPYDTYLLKELPCKANEGKTLVKATVTVKEDSELVNLGILLDGKIKTRVTTTEDKRYVLTSKNTTLVDTLAYDRLESGQTYRAIGTAIVKGTGEKLVVDGKTVEGTCDFVPDGYEGKTLVELKFDSTGLEGKEIVIFEKVYEVNEDGSTGDFIGSHEDLTDNDQTIMFYNPSYNMYKVRKTDAPEATDPSGKYGFAKGEKVQYNVYVENTGNVDLTMNVTDKFENEGYFTEPVVVKVTNATWNNEAEGLNEANITVKAKETAIVTYEAEVLDAPVKLADTAKDSDSLKNVDNSSSDGPNDTTTEQTDCNYKDQTNEPVDDGWTNTAYTKDVTYTIDDEDGHLDDDDDPAQTPIRTTPEIGTTFTADDSKFTVASDETKFIDTVEYKDLIPGNTYIMECTVMVKDKNAPLEKDGKPVTATKTFVAADAKDTPEGATPVSNGTVDVEFTLDTKGLEGKELVAFEKCFNVKPVDQENPDNPEDTPNTPDVEKNNEVANHEDIEDKGQTVEFANPSYNMFKIRTTKAPSAGNGKYGFVKGDKVNYDVHVINTGNIALTMDVNDEFRQTDYFSVPVVTGVKNATWNNKAQGISNTANITVEPGETAIVTYTITVTAAKVNLAPDTVDSDSKDKDGNNSNYRDEVNKPLDDGWTNRATTTNVTYEENGKKGSLDDLDDIAQTPIRKKVGPETGDNRNVIIFGGIAIIAIGGIIYLVRRKKANK